MKTKKGIVSTAMNIAIGIVLLVAIVIPFLSMGAAQNVTMAGLGLPAVAWTGIMLLILVVFVFGLIKHKK